MRKIVLKNNPVHKNKFYATGAEFNGQTGRMGEACGFGRVILSDVLYEGIILHDEANGYGRYIWNNGKYYEGYTKDNKCSGLGRLVHPDGRVFEGIWKDDELTYEDSKE